MLIILALFPKRREVKLEGWAHQGSTLWASPTTVGEQCPPDTLLQAPAPDSPEGILAACDLHINFSGRGEVAAWLKRTQRSMEREGGRSGKNRGNIRPFFTKASAYLLLTTGCMSLFIHICKWLVEDKILVFFLTFEHLVFFKYQSVVYFSQKLFLMSQGTRQIGCKTATTGMSQAECKLRICCTGLVVL